MSNRLKLCTVIRAAKIATVDDLCELIPMWSRKKIQDTLKDISTKNFILRKRDDVTGQPAYELTKAGLEFMKSSPENGAATQAGSGGTITPASAHCTTSLAKTQGKGADVKEPPKLDDKPAEACSDDPLPSKAVKILEKNVTAMPTDKACCNAAKVMATTAGAEVSSLNERIATMQEELNDRKETIDALNDDIRRQVQRAEAAERNRDDIAQVRDSLGKSIVSFCEWLADHFGSRVPMNLAECKHFLKDAVVAELSQQTAATQTGYTVSEIEQDDLGIVTHDIDQAKTNAIIATLKTGKRHGVFALVDRVESVQVEWAA